MLLEAVRWDLNRMREEHPPSIEISPDLLRLDPMAERDVEAASTGQTTELVDTLSKHLQVCRHQASRPALLEDDPDKMLVTEFRNVVVELAILAGFLKFQPSMPKHWRHMADGLPQSLSTPRQKSEMRFGPNIRDSILLDAIRWDLENWWSQNSAEVSDAWTPSASEETEAEADDHKKEIGVSQKILILNLQKFSRLGFTNTSESLTASKMRLSICAVLWTMREDANQNGTWRMLIAVLKADERQSRQHHPEGSLGE
ncbi:unnamed protein product [Protopolystoma xenopodis]|uniref:Uncharacterized protein n=1 Tax=Protopolystoma xenopodis TaxID=117903 RepID=A0A3S5A1M1_9PLAT|nr:unnamed protein product [Protopolystoma xenopodis]